MSSSDKASTQEVLTDNEDFDIWTRKAVIISFGIG